MRYEIMAGAVVLLVVGCLQGPEGPANVQNTVNALPEVPSGIEGVEPPVPVEPAETVQQVNVLVSLEKVTVTPFPVGAVTSFEVVKNKKDCTTGTCLGKRCIDDLCVLDAFDWGAIPGVEWNVSVEEGQHALNETPLLTAHTTQVAFVLSPEERADVNCGLRFSQVQKVKYYEGHESTFDSICTAKSRVKEITGFKPYSTLALGFLPIPGKELEYVGLNALVVSNAYALDESTFKTGAFELLLSHALNRQAIQGLKLQPWLEAGIAEYGAYTALDRVVPGALPFGGLETWDPTIDTLYVEQPTAHAGFAISKMAEKYKESVIPNVLNRMLETQGSLTLEGLSIKEKNDLFLNALREETSDASIKLDDVVYPTGKP